MSHLPTRVSAGIRFCLVTLVIGPLALTLAGLVTVGFRFEWLAALQTLASVVVHFACCMLLFFPAIAWTRQQQQTPPIPLLAGGAAILLVVATGLSVLINHYTGIDPRCMSFVYPRLLTYSFAFGPVLLLVEHLWDRLGEERRENKRRAFAQERERRIAAEARWIAVESRLHPHFVFNTLTAIRELTYSDQSQADCMIERFSELVRLSLEAPRDAMVSLEDELRMVRRYLEIEQMRFGPRLRWSVHAAGALGEAKLPPFCLLTLVENSVKHGVAARRTGGDITIEARVKNESLHLRVSDNGPGFPGDELPAGHGLDLLSERLELHYGNDAALRIVPNASGATVEVQVPLGALLAR